MVFERNQLKVRLNGEDIEISPDFDSLTSEPQKRLVDKGLMDSMQLDILWRCLAAKEKVSVCTV